jgi:hypothetical protein
MRYSGHFKSERLKVSETSNIHIATFDNLVETILQNP